MMSSTRAATFVIRQSETDSSHPVDPQYRARIGTLAKSNAGTNGGGDGREGWMEARVLRQHSDVQTSKHLDLSGSGRLCRVSALPSCCCDSSTTYPSLQRAPVSFFVFLRPRDLWPEPEVLSALILLVPPLLYLSILAFLARRCSW